MSTKEKIIKEIDNMPEKFLEQVYRFLHTLNSNKDYRKNDGDESRSWNELVSKQFLEGYAKSDAVYDKL